MDLVDARHREDLLLCLCITELLGALMRGARVDTHTHRERERQAHTALCSGCRHGAYRSKQERERERERERVVTEVV
ncbi:hypothetical protein GGS21DRAFT_11458 [Xylaria nigripes]|nr:hypothetical protein GGS21DRAFT_11458 [Xylaria nigripes]